MTLAEQSLTEKFKAVQKAGKLLVSVSKEQVNEVLLQLSAAAIANSEDIIAANQKDLERMSADDPKYDRLKLTTQRIQDIATEIKMFPPCPLRWAAYWKNVPCPMECTSVK